MHLIMRGDRDDIRHAEAMKLGKNWDTSSALGRRNATFIDTMKALINSARAFDLH